MDYDIGPLGSFATLPLTCEYPTTCVRCMTPRGHPLTVRLQEDRLTSD